MKLNSVLCVIYVYNYCRIFVCYCTNPQLVSISFGKDTFKIYNLGMREYLMEAIGTFFLVLAIGLSGEPIAIGLVLTSMIYVGAHISGAHYNPAVSFAFFISRRLSLKNFIGYTIGQTTGAFLAASLIVVLSTLPYYIEPPNDSTVYQQSMVEVVFTFALVLVYITVSTNKALSGNKSYGFIIGLALSGLTYMALPISGAIFNPAVSIGTSAFDLLLGGASYMNIPLYLFAPIAGAGLAAGTYRYLNY